MNWCVFFMFDCEQFWGYFILHRNYFVKSIKSLYCKMKNERPNVLLIMSDQHHAGIMGCVGDRKAYTPNLDDLARNGVIFTNAYCSFPLCGPSRMSFMTCRHPHEISIWDNESQLSSDIPTFAHSFLAAGYDTVLSGRMHFVGADQRHGFAERIIGDCPESVYLAVGWKLKKVLGNLIDTPGMSLAGIIKSGPGKTGYHAYDEKVTDVTVRWLKERGKAKNDRPFLLVVGYAAPHCPFVAPEKDFEFYREKFLYHDLSQIKGDMHPMNAKKRKQFGLDPPPPLDAQWRVKVAYYGLCTFLDRQIGYILDALKTSGFAKNTIVIYCSDHGESLGEHGLWWKSTFYDGSCKVPLIVSWQDRIKKGMICNENVSLMDVGTTIIAFAGINPLPGASGRSFRPLLEGRKGKWTNIVFAEYAERGSKVVCRMVRKDTWKYNYYHGMQPELSNLQDDREEMINLAGRSAYRKIEEELKLLALKNWDPDYISKYMERRNKELGLIAHWIKTTTPPEPVPPWFSSAPQNYVDDTITPDRYILINRNRKLKAVSYTHLTLPTIYSV